MMTALSYVFIDPVLFRVGPLEVRWYGLMYLLGFVAGYFVIKRELTRRNGPIPPEQADDLLFYLIVGLLVGARLGYAVFYNAKAYLQAPWEILAVWHGGMSFHGGLIGMVVAGFIFARLRGAPFMELADIGALSAPIGLMLGRLGNFVNGELFGRVTTVPWGIVFPEGGPLPRHPSQLYESFLEGPVLFMFLWWLRLRTKYHGEVLAVFLIGYGVLRFFVEFFREPDFHLGFIVHALTMGQLLCMAMTAAGIALLIVVRRSTFKVDH
ncbi:MAG: prolipoprotein diacylglyceryl transferase [Desulfomonilaceae bacterium]|nr:prolipoprotein diacylglyceryl transferase [Desulfomonilaceae bacterium]